MSSKSLQLTDNYGQTFNITNPVAQIGSGAKRTIALDEPDVLDLHAELRFEDLAWTLWDLSDGKGVRVNDEIIQSSKRLDNGDVITIGNSILRVAIQQQDTADDLSDFRSSGEIEGYDSEEAPSSSSEKKIAQKKCNTCGELIYDTAEICPHCGVRQKELPIPKQSGKSRGAAAAFAILLGGIGVHKFYLGQVGWGIVYLLFCWTYIPFLVGIIEGIYYLTLSEEKFATKYG
jgi:TM2 domain-containing membrane protein YozV